MARQVFYADRTKWLVLNLKIIIAFAVFAVFLWWLFTQYHDFYSLLGSILCAAGTVVRVVIHLVYRPHLTVDDGVLKMIRVEFPFAEVVDVQHTGEEYAFFLASRRRIIVSVETFSEADKKAIDKLLSEECLKYLAAPDAKEKIADANDVSKFEFSIRARHSSWFYPLYVFITAIMAIIAFVTIMMRITGSFAPLYPLFKMIPVWLVCYLIERYLPRRELSFRGDRFTLSRNGKVLKSFDRSEVEGVGFDPQGGKNYMFFRLAGKNKKLIIPFLPFGRKQIKFIVQTVRSIFFLPEKPAHGNKLFGF